jgi:hypothetical protein
LARTTVIGTGAPALSLLPELLVQARSIGVSPIVLLKALISRQNEKMQCKKVFTIPVRY